MKKYRKGMTKRIAAFTLAIILAANTIDLSVFAATQNAAVITGGLCEHHTEHTAECSYVEAVEGSPCTHEHDAECGYTVSGNGACTHEHDDACGYVAAVEGHECHYECNQCAVALTDLEDGEDATEPAPACTCGTDDDTVHATSCPAYVAPENPVCTCVEKCAEANVWCDVCGFDVTACTGEDTAVTYDTCTCEIKCVDSGNTECTVCSAEDAVLADVCTGTEQAADSTIDATAMTADELQTAIAEKLTAGETTISIALAENADATMFNAIETALAADGITAGSINLTISGATSVPEDVFDGDQYTNENNYKAAWVLRSVTLPDATTIGEAAFSSCLNMTSFSAPKAITIADSAFATCYSLAEVKLPLAQSIGGMAFSGCETLKEISLPECTNIGDDAFMTCIALETFYGPKVTTIGYAAFEMCDVLTKITFGTVTSVYQNLDYPTLFQFSNDTENIDLTLYCTQKAMTFNSSTKYWNATEEDFEGGNEFIGYTFKSITLSHPTADDDGDCTTAVVCSACGDVLVEAKAQHTGGTATCTTQAACEVCGTSYGEKNSDNHALDTFTYTANADGTTHTKKHKCCDVVVNEAEVHSFDENRKCVCDAVCGTDVNHALTYTDKEGSTHTETCDNCDYEATVAHSYVDGTCACGKACDHSFDANGKCGVCGQQANMSVTDGTTTYYALDADALKAAVTTLLDSGKTTIIADLPADASYEMFHAIHTALLEACETEVVSIDSIDLTLNGVTKVPANAFYYEDEDENGYAAWYLHSVTLPEVTEIGDHAFESSMYLTSVSAPKATKIGNLAFTVTYIEEVYMPDVTEIGYMAFSDNGALTTVYLPKVTKIGYDAFVSCYYLKEVTFGALESVQMNPDTGAGIFGDNAESIDLTLACGQNAMTTTGSVDTDNLYYIATGDAFAGGTEFIGHTFKSITTAHSLSYTDNSDGTHKESCSACDYEATVNHTLSYTDNGDGTHTATCSKCEYETTVDHTLSYSDNGDGTHEVTCSACDYEDTVNHTYTYTADDDTHTITESCGCDYSKTITLVAPTDAVYTDNKIEATVSGSIAAKHTVTYTNASGDEVDPINAGDYTATLTAGGKSVSVTYTINKADSAVLIHPTANTLTYNGAVQKLVTAGTASGGDLQYSVNYDDETYFSYDIPLASDAGTHTVYYKVVGDNNHNDTQVYSIQVTIGKATPEYTVPTGLTAYLGQTLADVTLPFRWEWVNSSLSVGAEGANQFEATFTPEDATNYNTVTIQVTVTVSKEPATVTTAPAAVSGLEYTGEEQALVTAGEANGGTVQYKLGENGTYSESIPTAAAAGTYTVFWKVVGDETHSDTAEQSIAVTIAKAASSITKAPEAVSGLTYTGSAQELIAEGTAEGGTMQYSLNSTDWSDTIPTGTDAGDYTVYYKVVGDANHENVAEASFTVAIGKAKAEINVDTTSIIVTYGDTVTLPNATSNFGTVDCDKDAEDLVDAGTYTVTYTVEGTDNYAGATKTVTVTIEPKVVSSPVFDGLEQSYLYQDGAEIKPTFTLKDGTTEIPASEYTVKYSENTEVGTATITITDNEGGNYTVSGSATFKIVVHTHVWSYEASGATITATCSGTIGTCPATNKSISIVAPTDLTYDGTAKEATITGSIENVTAPTITYNTDDGSAPVNAGTYTASITLGDAEASVEFTIEKADITKATASVNDTDTYNYTGSEIIPDVTVTLDSTMLIKDTDYTVSYSDNINAGTATVTVTGKGNYTGTKTVTFEIVDKMAPTAAIEIENNSWTAFWNWATFGYFFKDTVDVTITADGTGSDVAKVEYLLSATALDADSLPDNGWTEVTASNGKYEFSITELRKAAVYVQVTDAAGNSIVINSEGIVVYADSSISSTEIAYTYKESTAKTVEITLNGNSFAKLTDGNDTEISADNYTIDNNGSLTLQAEYLDTLDKGEYTYQIHMNPQGEETSEVALTYSFKVVVEARELTISVTATDRDYQKGNNKVDIEVALSGIVGNDDVSLENANSLQGTLSGENVGTYDKVTLPTLTLTGDDANNYYLSQSSGEVTLGSAITINKLDGTITVGTSHYDKTYGDANFTLDVTDNNPEADVTYSSNDENVVTVSNGTVTIQGAGTATITVSLAESNNYNAAASKSITVNVDKKTGYTVDVMNRSYYYARENADSINLADVLPADCGSVSYGTPATSGTTVTYSTAPSVTDGVLSYKVAKGTVGNAGTITVVVTTQNYADITITVNVRLIDQLPVSVQEGEIVSLNNSILTYGEALSELTFKTVTFVDDSGNAVAGTLAWKEPNLTPNAGTASATWVFTPKDEAYAASESTVAIIVNKATPTVSAVPTVAERTYHPSTALADNDLTGGVVTGVDGNTLAGTWSWQSTGVIPVVNNSGYIAVFTPTDTTNYETVTRTITVSVTKATPAVVTLPTATTITYGDALSASSLSGTAQYSSSDSTTVAGSFAWQDSSVKPTVADSNTTAYAVIFTPVDSSNYNTVETTATLTVNRAKDTPNMPDNTMSVVYTVKTVGAVTLPEGWAWQDSDKETALKVGEAVSATAVYVGSDKGNYETESVTIAITRAACTHNGDTQVRDEVDVKCTTDGYTGDTYCLICEDKIASGESIPATGHADANKDHACDNGCDVVQGTCEDTDKDHACDYGCDKAFGTCEDADKDHACDYGCDKVYGTCEDADKDHVCDYGCGKEYGTCEDVDKDHACDYGCDKVYGICEDTDKDHACDYGCGKVYGTCEDANKDHTCDYGCGKEYGTCEDADKDHTCDYGCGKEYGTCEDTEKDHKCDYGCDKTFGTCEDTDKDHVCDYGCGKVYGTCEDADKDHACDYGCGKEYGTCEDADKDHTCDYGCGKTYGTCEDADKDHTCDYGCGKEYGTCEDTDKDHACDYGCDKEYGTCEDADKDHTCDYGCGKAFGTCEDVDKDHACDYGCDKAFGTCEDTNKDHACDYGCDKVFEKHEAETGKHTCSYCGSAITECADETKDHMCDVCGEKLSDCTDADDNHICDICDVELTHNYDTEWKSDAKEHWYECSCGVKKDAAEHTFTGQVTKAPTVHAAGEKTYTCDICGHSYTEPVDKLQETPTQPAVDPGKPFIQDNTGKIGWEVIRNETAKAKEGDTVIVDMNGTTSVPGQVFDDIKGRDITITFDMGTGVSWTVNGKDITADKVTDINFEVKVGTKENPINTIPVDVINKVTGEKYSINISLTHDGELGLKAILNINLDKKNTGLFANLFYYNEQYKAMQFVWADDIDEYGTAHLVFTHASEYTIVIDKDILQGNVSSPKTGEEATSLGLMLLVFLAAGSYLTLKRRKRA